MSSLSLMSIAAIASAAVSAGGLAYNVATAGDAQKAQQKAASDAAKAAGTAQKATAADTSNLTGQNNVAAAGVNSGPASTLLTGSGGVSNSALNLGSTAGLGANTLLGS